MKLKITGNSKNPEEVKIVDIATGDELMGVVHTEIHIDPFDVKAILILDDFEFDLETDTVLNEAT